ncbi:ubiquitin C-terminal hydrolase [Streptococcus suis]|nr:ubiquitin C-terminal hydrolase [Streptococcus suis]CYW06190.1 ubiquitin C-terminal hydrolase [Streptococcus suis]CYW68685.1 ubiquitin C-terminal hydrolase [Streptococcus suis]CYX02903.1 ubiquitin C-terminal hydrolase [Streptococcus suis]CYX70356.1 ubiquitin C-terminal hydrolase [Streptococcus suis]
MFVCKKRLVLFTGLLFLSIGGMMMFNFHRMSEEEKLQAQIRKEQERMVLYAVNHYEGIEKIEFTSFEENKMTGSWSAGAILNDDYKVTITAMGFDGDLSMNDGPSDKTGLYLRIKDKPTTISIPNQIEVIYFEGDNQ